MRCTGCGITLPDATSRQCPACGTTVPGTRNRRWWVLVVAFVAVGVAVGAVLLLRMVSADTTDVASQPDFTAAQLEGVTRTAFPDWTVSSARAPSINDGSVSAVAYAKETTGPERVAAVYLYRSIEGVDAPGESLLRTNWTGILEVEYGVPYDWIACGNVLILAPEDELSAVQGRLPDIGC